MRDRSKAKDFIKNKLKLDLSKSTVVFQDTKASVLIITSMILDMDFYEYSTSFREYCDFEWLELRLIQGINNIKFREEIK